MKSRSRTRESALTTTNGEGNIVTLLEEEEIDVKPPSSEEKRARGSGEEKKRKAVTAWMLVRQLASKIDGFAAVASAQQGVEEYDASVTLLAALERLEAIANDFQSFCERAHDHQQEQEHQETTNDHLRDESVCATQIMTENPEMSQLSFQSSQAGGGSGGNFVEGLVMDQLVQSGGSLTLEDIMTRVKSWKVEEDSVRSALTSLLQRNQVVCHPPNRYAPCAGHSLSHGGFVSSAPSQDCY